jgi:hypothetical protein
MLLSLALLVAFAESTSWYAAYGVSEKDAEYLKEKRCFRGTYGVDEISLLTCSHEDSQFLAEIPDHTPVCILELAQPNDERVAQLATQSGEVTVLYNFKRSLVLAAKDSSVVDYPAACFAESVYGDSVWNSIPVPTRPMLPIERHELPKSSAPNPKITALLNLVTAANLRTLDTELSTIHTRHSQSTAGGQEAVRFASNIFNQSGFQTVSQSINRTGYFPNVVGIKRGTVNPASYVVVGAHLDDRMQTLSDATSRAPGADDNGSGSSAVLELAKLIHRQNLTFQNTLMLTLFSGEEQGLYGSQFQAQQMRNNNTPIGNVPGLRVLGMYNVDMIGYNNNNPTNNALAFMSGNSDSTLTNNCRNTIIPDYMGSSAAFPTGTTSACCSDQQSYYQAGFPALGIFETATTRVVYPQYHMSTDLPQYLDFNQMERFSKAFFACALTAAVPN